MEQKHETAARVQDAVESGGREKAVLNGGRENAGRCVKVNGRVTGVLASDGRSLLASNGLVMTADGKLALEEGELREMFTTEQRTVLEGITDLLSRNMERHVCMMVLNFLEMQQRFGTEKFPDDKIMPMYCTDAELRSCVTHGVRAVKTLLEQRKAAERRAAGACRQLIETMGEAARTVIARYGLVEGLRYYGVNVEKTEYCHGTT